MRLSEWHFVSMVMAEAGGKAGGGEEEEDKSAGGSEWTAMDDMLWV